LLKWFSRSEVTSNVKVTSVQMYEWQRQTFRQCDVEAHFFGVRHGRVYPSLDWVGLD